MNAILTFLIAHWALSSAFVVVLATLLLTSQSKTVKGVTFITAADLVSMMNREKTLILDNREKAVFDNGHILGAKHVPEGEDETKAAMALIDKHKSLPVIMVGQTEAQALRLANTLVKQGIQSVFCLRGGIGAWREASLPLLRENAVNPATKS